MDGGARGELEFESFSADAITLTFQGFNTHPGYAKGRMVNAIKLAARFIDRLPPTGCRRRPPRATRTTSTPTSCRPASIGRR
jgi:di/tripeptidase